VADFKVFRAGTTVPVTVSILNHVSALIAVSLEDPSSNLRPIEWVVWSWDCAAWGSDWQIGHSGWSVRNPGITCPSRQHWPEW